MERHILYEISVDTIEKLMKYQYNICSYNRTILNTNTLNN